MNKTTDIAIIGGGIGGLTTAIALRKKGFTPIVFEQAEELQAIGSGILLGLNAMSALSKLGLGDEIAKEGFPVNTFHIRSPSGHSLTKANFKNLSQKLGVCSIGIARAKLHRILQDAIPKDSLYLGHSFNSFTRAEKKTIIEFKTGKKYQADLVIAADGVHSASRKFLLSENNLIYSGYTGWRGLAPLPEDFPNYMFETWGVGKRFGAIKISNDTVYWYSLVNAPVNTAESDALKAQQMNLQLFLNWHSPIQELIESTHPNCIVPTDIYDAKPYKVWHSSSVVFLGDSIHPTTPNLGAGAAMAIESALVLSRCIAHFDNQADAFREYQALRLGRTKLICRTSNQLGRSGQIKNTALCVARNLLIKASYTLLPQFIQERRLRKLFDYEIKF